MAAELTAPPEPVAAARAHTERAFYKVGYTSHIFGLMDRLYPYVGREIALGLGRAIAGTYAQTHPGVVEVVRRNIELIAPSQATTETAHRVFTEYGATIADYIAIGNMTPADAADLCVERSGLEHLEEARRRGTGAILVTGHLGFFEFGSLLLRQYGFDVSIVTLSEPTEALTRWRADFRRRWGTETIEIGRDAFSSLEVTRAVGNGRYTAMLVDRPFGPRACEIPIGNGRALFSEAPAMIAWISGCPIIPVAITRSGNDHYRMVAHPCIWSDPTLSRSENIQTMTRRSAEALITEFERAPEQWYHFIPIGR